MPVQSPTEKQLLEQLLMKRDSSDELVKSQFEKLYVHIEHIQEKHEKTSDLIEKIHEKLSDPTEGLYAKVNKINTHIENINQDIENINQDIVKITTENATFKGEGEKRNKAIEENTQVIGTLKRIAGTDLEDLRSIIETKKALSKLYWSLLLSLIISIASGIYTVFKNVH